MPTYLYPSGRQGSGDTIRVFARSSNGVAPEEFVIPVDQVLGSFDAVVAEDMDDDTYVGSVITGINAGATIAQWEAVYLASDGTWKLADGNGSGTYPARGLATAAGSVALGELVVLREGRARNDAWAWTPGANLYLSNTPGGLTQTASVVSGERVQAVGFALTADIVILDFTNQFATNP